MTPRLTPLAEQEWDDEAREALRSLLPPERRNPRDAGNVVSTLVHHPALTHAYLTFNAHVLRDSTLSARVREVALLRVVHRNGSDYLWHHHIPFAERAGLTAAEIDGIRAGDLPDGADRSVLAAVDELDTQRRITDATWTELGRHFDDRQRLDLLFTVGCYAMLATAVNTLGIEAEAE